MFNRILNTPLFWRHPACFSNVSGMYLEPSPTSMMELFCKNSQQLLVVNSYCKKSPSWIFDKVLNTPLSFMLTVWEKSFFPNSNLTTLTKAQINILETIFVLWNREWLLLWKCLSFMVIKSFYFLGVGFLIFWISWKLGETWQMQLYERLTVIFKVQNS